VGDVGGDEGDVGGDEGDMVTFVHNGFTARSTMPLAEGDRVKWYNNQVRARGGREEGERMARGGEEHNIYPSSFPLCTKYTPLPSIFIYPSSFPCALYIPLFLPFVHYIYPSSFYIYIPLFLPLCTIYTPLFPRRCRSSQQATSCVYSMQPLSTSTPASPKSASAFPSWQSSPTTPTPVGQW
jgi:hypothetical protein